MSNEERYNQGVIVYGGKLISKNLVIGSNSTINNIYQNKELKTLLNQLQTLINNSTLSEQDKKDALTEIQAITEAATKPKEEQESIIRKTLRYFNGLGTELQDIPETIKSITEIVEKIGVVFSS